MQTVAVVVVEYLPAAQIEQALSADAVPCDEMYVPAAQYVFVMHDDDTAAEYFPLAQSVHSVMVPNSCFFGSGFSANSAQNPEPFHFFDSGFSAKLAEKPEPKGFIKKVDGGVRLGGESCNWYCRSVLFRFTVLRRKICVGGGITVSNRSFPFGRFWFLACVPLAWLTLG